MIDTACGVRMEKLCIGAALTPLGHEMRTTSPGSATTWAVRGLRRPVRSSNRNQSEKLLHLCMGALYIVRRSRHVSAAMQQG